MARMVGVQARGIRAPIVKEGDDAVNIVVESVMESCKEEGFSLKDGDVIGVTESLIARSQGNYVTVDDISEEISRKFGSEIGVVFPILSRNRFSLILKGIARGAGRVIVQLAYPSDEVGNHLMDPERMYKFGINPYTNLLSLDEYRNLFGKSFSHHFTGIDYVSMYISLAVNNNIEIFFSNDPADILKFTPKVLAADIHTRKRTKDILKNAGADIVYGLDDICSEQKADRGYNPEYGLLGSNKASEERLKLFPRNGQEYVEKIQGIIKQMTDKNVEVMIYGDGAFKDPVGKIWELADPVVSPAYTSGLIGTPNEIKLKYIADEQLGSMSREEAKQEMHIRIREKDNASFDPSQSQGTTPRRLTDILGSLCDLTSGSGDKGTPIVLIQGYFDNYATE